MATETTPTEHLSLAEGLIADPDPRRRVEAARRIARLALEDEQLRARAVGALGRLVGDEADYVRWNVAVALGQLGDPRGLPFLRTQTGDEHANVRLRLALAVALIGDPDGLDVLVRLAEDPYQIGDARPVRGFAALALGLLGAPGGVEALAALAADDDPEVRWHATVALGDLGQEAGVEALVARTEDEVPFVRAHAAIALAEIGSPGGLDALRRLAAREQVERVRGIAERSLAALEEASQ